MHRCNASAAVFIRHSRNLLASTVGADPDNSDELSRGIGLVRVCCESCLGHGSQRSFTPRYYDRIQAMSQSATSAGFASPSISVVTVWATTMRPGCLSSMSAILTRARMRLPARTG